MKYVIKECTRWGEKTKQKHCISGYLKVALNTIKQTEYQRFGLDRFHCIYKWKYW
jgi:hypothetical protein